VSAMSKQRELAGARLVSDAARVLAAELGADAAARVLQDCEAQVRRHPPKRDVSTRALAAVASFTRSGRRWSGSLRV
jgi:hypothetical protein